MKKLFLSVIILINVFLLFAEEGYVTFVDGYADLQDGSDWIYLDIGDTVKESDTIKLDYDSFIEIKFHDTKLTISQEGTYHIDSLLSDDASLSNSNFGSKVNDIFSKLLYEDKSLSQSTVGGVRASDAALEADNIFGEGYFNDIAAEAKDMYKDGDIDSAYDLFLDAYDFAEDNEQETEALYYLALISYESGEIRNALSYIDDIYLNEYSDFYGYVVFLKGKILLDTHGYQQSLDWLAENPLEEDDPLMQSVMLIEGLATIKNGDASNGKTILKQCAALNPNSDLAGTAQYFINQ